MNCTASATDWIRSSSLIRVVITIGLARTKRPRTGLVAYRPRTGGKLKRPGGGDGNLLAGPDRLALFGKGRGTLFCVGRRKNGRRARALQVEHVGLAPVFGGRDDFFG